MCRTATARSECSPRPDPGPAGRSARPGVEIGAVTRTLRAAAAIQLITLVAGTLAAATAAPARPVAPLTPPAGAISRNVEYVANLPEAASAISLNFIGDTMFVSTVKGL